MLCHGQVASGANLIVFTTGRGSVSGYKPSPCIKLSSNSDLFARMGEDIDINCGDIVEGVSLATRAQRSLKRLLMLPVAKRQKVSALVLVVLSSYLGQIGAVL